MNKGIIFDFDGVIVDSIQAKTDGFVHLYKKYGKAIVSEVIKHHELNGGVSRFEKIKFYHESLLNKKISNQEIKILSNQFSLYVVNRVVKAPYILGALKFIQQNFNKIKLFISTGTPTEEINKILIARKIKNYFIDVFGSPASKDSHIIKIQSKYNLKSDELIFFGDSKTDLDAATNNKIPFILIENSFNRDLLKIYEGKTIKNFMEIL